MEDTANKGNSTAEDLEKLRKERLKESIYGKKIDEPIDKKIENDYIKDDTKTDDSDVDQDSAKYKDILDSKFKGDGTKATKSYIEAQKSVTKFMEENKQLKEQLSKIENNETLKSLVDLAEKEELDIEKIQHFLRGSASDKDKHVEPKPNGNLYSQQNNTVSEKDLATAGLLNPDEKDAYSDSEWKSLVREARIRFIEDTLPERIIERTEKRILENQKKKQEEELKQNNKTLTASRFSEGVDKILEEYDFDVTGNEEHQKAFEELKRTVSFILDPDKPGVIHPNAVNMAMLQIAGKYKINRVVNKKADVENKVDNMFQDTGFNANKRQPEKKKPVTLADKLRERKMQDYQRDVDYRKGQFVTKINK